MDVGRVRAAGASLVSVALLGLVASPALASSGVTVGSVSSLKAGASAGTLQGQVLNATSHAARTDVSVRVMRRGTHAKVIGRTTVNVPAKGAAAYTVAVKLPSGLSRGSYYLSSCTPSGNGAGKLGCATAEDDVPVKGGFPVRGAQAAAALAAKAAQAESCTAGGRTLSKPGMKVYPETGNTGYTSVHTDVHINYDAPANRFLDGTYVDLQQRSTQCLSELSLDFERTNTVTSTTVPGPNLDVSAVLVNGQPATFTFKQPTYPGDPNGQDDPDPAAHAASLNNPVSATNPNPPACNPPGSSAALNGAQCPATKLVITPSTPIPSGTAYTVTVKYTGRPGVHVDGDGSTEGWFRNNNPVGDGGFVTTEPVGTMAWMPLNDHPSAKPTYDFYDTISYDVAAPTNRVAIGNGRLISTVINPAEAAFPTGSRTFHWKSPEPVASYLVENTMGFYSLDERVSGSGTIYYEAQAEKITPDKQLTNKAVMDLQEDITNFQSRFNGPFPFSTDGVIVGIPSASFEEEMQTKITFAGGSISPGVFHHENMHQWWGDNVSEGSYNLTFFKEGYADLSEGLNNAWTAAKNAGGLDTPAGDAAFDTSLVNRFNTTYNNAGTSWSAAPSNPTASNLFGSQTYTRSGRAYIALRQILGKDNFNQATQEIQRTFGGSSITEPAEIAIFHKWIPNQSAECSAKLDEFFKQWWDTSYTGAGNKPQITGPGLAGRGFYDAGGGCGEYGVQPVGGTVSPTLSLTLGPPAAFAPFTPGISRTYTAGTTATVVSSAGDATLSVTDPSTTSAGHLVNGAFALRLGLQAQATSAAGTGSGYGSISGAPLSLLTYGGPVANDAVAIGFRQSIAATDPLRTGTYGKTLTFTLSTTTP